MIEALCVLRWEYGRCVMVLGVVLGLWSLAGPPMAAPCSLAASEGLSAGGP